MKLFEAKTISKLSETQTKAERIKELESKKRKLFSKALSKFPNSKEQKAVADELQKVTDELKSLTEAKGEVLTKTELKLVKEAISFFEKNDCRVDIEDFSSHPYSIWSNMSKRWILQNANAKMLINFHNKNK